MMHGLFRQLNPFLLRTGFVLVSAAIVAIEPCCAQKVVIDFRNGTQKSERLKTYSDEYLLTWSGHHHLAGIRQITFRNVDAEKAEFFVEKLRQSGIVVVIGDQKLDPLVMLTDAEAEAAVVPDSLDEVHETYGRFDKLPHGGLGIGLGMDFGGIGLRGSAYLGENVDLFGGVGYALAGVGYNVGFIFGFTPKERVHPTLSAMFGTNAGLLSETNPSQNEMFLGPSFGAGIKIRGKGNPMNYFHLQVVFAVLSEDFYNKVNQSNARETGGPVFLSLGYVIGFHKTSGK